MIASVDMPAIYIGLPYLGGELSARMTHRSSRVLVSVGSLYVDGAFKSPPLEAWNLRPALDSSGFVAMVRFGGYRWTPYEYVDWIVTNGRRCEMPFPWAWWSAMDYCCEPEIASNRAEVERRIQLTVETYGECLDALQGWREEGVTDIPDPLPILQGRTAADYLACAEALAARIDTMHACCCPTDPEACRAEWHRSHAGLPALVGLGSVCRRELFGDDGLIPILEALHAVLPAHVQLHLFGVKGEALSYLHNFGTRVASVDSAAWDSGARNATARARKTRAAQVGWEQASEEVVNDLDHRLKHLDQWMEQAKRLQRQQKPLPAKQVPLFRTFRLP